MNAYIIDTEATSEESITLNALESNKEPAQTLITPQINDNK